MQIFLVGGAVRDELLDFPIKERDWVVLGATPQQMLDLGFDPVGKDFPVFLHPKSKEEYALARTERKTGPGYTGFKVYAAADVTLEEDLARRDLTINAIAKDEAGGLIDPYQGQEDIKSRTLRHVSPAFSEDPVRILRLARFAARFHHLGFEVASETNTLMQEMVSAGEVDHLVPERVWKELSRALGEHHPEVFITTLKTCGALDRILPEIAALFGVPQRKKFHPEVDTGIHTLMSLQQACLLSNEPAVRFATLLHDLGKAQTPQDILPRHHGHEAASIPLVKTLCERIGVPNEFKELALHVAQYHTHIHRALTLKASTVVKLLNTLDAFRRPQRFEHFLLSCKADARGRTGFEETVYEQMDFMLEALAICNTVIAQPFLEQGIVGKAIGENIHKQRIHCIKQLKKKWGNDNSDE